MSKTAADYTGSYALKWVASKTSDEYLPKSFLKPVNPAYVFNGTPIRPPQTTVESLSNWLAAAGVLMLILGIIYTSKLHEKKR